MAGFKETPHAAVFDDVSVDELRRRRSYKWTAYPPHVLPAFVAEMDCALAEPIARALIEAVQLGDTGYAWHNDELTDALLAFARTAFGWEIDRRRLTLVPDALVGITELLRAALRPGDRVIVNTPVYPPFFRHVAQASCTVVEVPLVVDEAGLSLDINGIELALAAGARAILLCNPHNPTGMVASARELEQLAEVASRHGALVIADEIHAPLALVGARHVPFVTVSDAARECGISVISASKAWNVPGLKCAHIITASDSTDWAIRRLPTDLVFRTGLFGVIATTAAYRDSGGWLEAVRCALDRNRDHMRELVASQLPGVTYTPGAATYFAWLDCRGLGFGAEPADIFRDRGNVAVAAGRDFGALGAGHVRVTIATSLAMLDEVVQRMSSAIRHG